MFVIVVIVMQGSRVQWLWFNKLTVKIKACKKLSGNLEQRMPEWWLL